MFTKNESKELIEVLTYVGDNLGPKINELALKVV